MKTVLKKVYYCDHCNKRSLAAGHLRNHERSCTANPNRFCKMCERKNVGSIIEEFKKRFTLTEIPLEYMECGYDVTYKVNWIGEPVTLDEVKKSVNDCPCCVFAIIRQCKFNHHFFEFEKYDFKQELADEFAERNRKAQREDVYY